MKKYVVFFEAEGGTDKGPDGHRRDTMPMVEALRASGWSAEIIRRVSRAGVPSHA